MKTTRVVIQLLITILIVSCLLNVETNNKDLVVVEPDGLDWLSDKQFESSNKIYGVAVSHDEADLAVYTSKSISIYDTKTLKLNRVIDTVFNSAENSLPVSFSPDGMHIAFAQDKDVVLWNLKTDSRDAIIKSLAGDTPPFYVEFSPSGNRVILSTYSSTFSTEARATNFALYDLQGTMLFNKFLIADHFEYYYRLTTDDKLYIFSSSILSDTFPLTLDIIDTITGKSLESITYDFRSNSYNSRNVFYDVSIDGQLGAVDLVQNDVHRTMLVNPITRDEIEVIDDGLVSFLPPDKNGKNQWESQIGYRITGRFYIPAEVAQRCNFGERQVVNGIMPLGEKLIFLLPHSNAIRALEIWDTVNCRIEKGIIFAHNN